MIIKRYRFRIYPNKEQRILIQKTFGCVRYVYNKYLEINNKLYDNYKEGLTSKKCMGAYEGSRVLTKIKRSNDWLQEPDKWALQNALKNGEKAYKRFRSGQNRHPRFKSKKNHYQSYTTTYTNKNIGINNWYIKLPKLRLVKYRDNQAIEGRILNATIIQNPDGKYYVSICCTDIENSELPKTNRNVGIDLGLKEFAITSDGIKYENHRYLTKSLEKIKKLQWILSRRVKGSKNYEKARIKLAKTHAKIVNQRQDFSHKLSTQLVKDYDVIVVETLRVRNMLKNHSLAQAISDTSWYDFVEKLKCKSEWYGKQLVKIDSFYPSSQLCSNCGYRNRDVKNLNVRTWTCPECGNHHDRDINAAKNILSKGLESI